MPEILPVPVSKRRRKKSPQEKRRKQRDTWLRCRFGIRLKDYEKLLEAQGGKCAICLAPPEDDTKPLHVDHCHATGKIRGLLCVRYNLILGNMGDTIPSVMKFVRYLRTPPAELFTNKRRGKQRIPKMWQRKGGIAFVTDSLTRKQVYLGKWGTPQANEAYNKWLTDFKKRLEVSNSRWRLKQERRPEQTALSADKDKVNENGQGPTPPHSEAVSA